VENAQVDWTQREMKVNRIKISLPNKDKIIGPFASCPQKNVSKSPQLRKKIRFLCWFEEAFMPLERV
jgi:hypothetical protein